MAHSLLPFMLLSVSHALEGAVPPIWNRCQGVRFGIPPCCPLLCCPCPPTSEIPPTGVDSAPRLTRSVRRPLDQVGCGASRSMCPRICPNRHCVKWLSVSCRMKYRAYRIRRPPSDHWISSSARSSSDGGIVSPSAFAVPFPRTSNTISKLRPHPRLEGPRPAE